MAVHASRVRRLLDLARNSPWIAMAIALHVIAVAVLSIVVVRREKPTERESVIEIRVSRNVEPPRLAEPVEMPTRVLTPPPDRPIEISDRKIDESFVPFVEEPIEVDLTQDIGMPDGDGRAGETSTNAGVGKGGVRGREPSPFPRRGSDGDGSGTGPRGNRSSLGEVRYSEKAVKAGLLWLLRHQAPDGSWSLAAAAERCNPRAPCFAPEVELRPYYDEGLTALALLAFLGHGIRSDGEVWFVDTDRDRKYDASAAVNRALHWLLDRQKRDGSVTADRPFLYNEALAAMALSEAYGLTRNRGLKRRAQKAVDFLVAAQKPAPDGEGLWGWRYSPRGPAEEAWSEANARLAALDAEREELEGELARLDAEREAGALASEDHEARSAPLRERMKALERELYETRGALADAEAELHDADVSVTTWCVLALKSAELCGLDVPEVSMQGALDFTRFVTADDGLVGYQLPGQAGLPIAGPGDQFTYHVGTMTALGMCVRTFVTHDLADPFLEQGALRLVADLPRVTKDRLSVDYYYWYYATLALDQFDGPGSPREGAGAYWKPWDAALKEAVLDLQTADDGREACADGGWLQDDRWSHAGHAVYNTALNVLTLEVYYRYENAFGSGASERGR